MLAQNFKTAADLGISEIEVDALIKVLGMLEREELVLAPSTLRPMGHNGFSMSNWGTKTDCGTVGCICGWAQMVAKAPVFVSRERRPIRVHKLFTVDSNFAADWGKITPAQAATALRSYLTTGEANWAEALATA